MAELIRFEDLTGERKKERNITNTIYFTIPMVWLKYNNNKLTNLRSEIFTGLGNLVQLYLDNNEISDIEAGTFNSTPQLRHFGLSNNSITMFPFEELSNQTFYRLYVDNNQLTTLPSKAYDILASIPFVSITNNPWHCDCRMVDFRLRMTGYHTFEQQIICAQPGHLHGQQLKDINPKDLMSDDIYPTIVRFKRLGDLALYHGETLYLFCKASGIPTPDITVILPSGLNATVESEGRVTMDVNGTIIVANVTAADSGLYICVASNFVGSTFATLVVDMVSVPAATFSLSVLLGAICGSTLGTVLIGGIILTIWCRRNTKSPPKGPDVSVVFNNTNTRATVITNNQTRQHQTMSESTNDRNSQHAPRPAYSQFEPYEDVEPPPTNPRPRGAVPRKTATRHTLRPPKRNNGEPPPVPPPRTASAACENVPEYKHESSHHYQPLRKPEKALSSAGDSQHHYQSLQRPQNPP